MPPMAFASWPTIGAPNTSFLPRKRTVRPLWATTMATAVASKYERWLATRIAGPAAGMWCTPSMSHREGEARRPVNARASCWGSRSSKGSLGTPGGTSRCTTGQPGQGHDQHPRIRVDRHGVPHR